MKKHALSLALAGCLLLSGCKPMLERSYSTVTPHADRPTTAEDPSVLRVENYQELVSAVLFLVSQRAEEGTIQLHNYDGEEESDLTAACLEVATQDPLGAYAVDYIKHELSRVVSYYQATLAIRYRRTEEQVESIVSVNGSGAIRDRLQEALAELSSEAVLRIPYFFGDEETIRGLLREAYYAQPALALGIPQAEVSLYPDSGRERIVEITLEYPEDAETLREKRTELAHRAAELIPGGTGADRESAARLALAALWESGEGSAGNATEEAAPEGLYDPQGGSTAYAALVEGRADGEGLALGYAVLCAREEVPCGIVEGTFGGEKRFWNVLELSGGETLYIDPSLGPEWDVSVHPKEEFFTLGYFLPET